jgi:hypothetical protein
MCCPEAGNPSLAIPTENVVFRARGAIPIATQGIDQVKACPV